MAGDFLGPRNTLRCSFVLHPHCFVIEKETFIVEVSAIGPIVSWGVGGRERLVGEFFGEDSGIIA